MTRYLTFVTSVLLVSSLGFVAAPALAAPQDCGARGPHGESFGHHARHMKQHHKKLHSLLKLTPEQEVAWKKMVDIEQPMMDKADPMKSDDWAKLTTPERADRMVERMKAHHARQVEQVAAMKEFYAVLSPEQKKIFDDFHATGMRGKPGPRATASAKAPAKP